MLGSLARKLRALGFDAAYYKSGSDAGIVSLAEREGRAVLTADRSLAAYTTKRGVRSFLLIGRSDGARLASLARAARLSGFPLVAEDPLCSLCGGELEELERREVAGLVPPAVERSHRLFFHCTNCGQFYWRGSHWKKLRSLARRLKAT